jgi:hypothetical protein
VPEIVLEVVVYEIDGVVDADNDLQCRGSERDVLLLGVGVLNARRDDNLGPSGR